jgi:hypothetical protein
MTRQAFIVFILAAAPLASADALLPSRPDTNLLSLERMGAGAPAGWKTEGENVECSPEPTPGPFGIGAWRLHFPGGGKMTLTSPARMMRAGENHAVALWLRSDPPGAKVEISLRDNDNEGASALRETFAADNEWRQTVAQGVLPKAVKGRYYLTLTAEGQDCTLWLDGLWLGEHEGAADAAWRPQKYAAGVVLEPEAAWGVVAGNGPLNVKACVVGVTGKGCRLQLRGVNTLGTTASLASVDLDDSGVWRRMFEVAGEVARPFGMMRVEAAVIGPDGQPLSARSETLLARAPEPIPGPLPESYFGVHVSLREPDVAAVARLGYKWCRIHDASGITKWGRVEPEPGKWVWRDEDIAVARRYGLSVLGMLDGSPPWASGTKEGGYFSIYGAPKNIADWRNYVKTVVSRYAGSIDEWEVWNEPWDMKRFFQNGSPQRYVELLKAAYEEAKAANPNCAIVGVDTYPPLWDLAVLAFGAYPYYDHLSWHRYDPTLQGRPNDAIARVAARLKTEQMPNGTPKPILCTEGGPDVAIFHGSFFSFADPFLVGDWSEGADRYARMFLSMIAAGNRRFIAYSVHTNNRHGQLTHNMVEPNFLLRPMHLTVAALAHFIDGARYETRLTPAPDISAFVFEQPNARRYGKGPVTVAALIADGEDPQDLPRPLPPGIQCFDRWGNPADVPKQAARGITFLIADAQGTADLLDALTGAPETAQTGKADLDALLNATVGSLTRAEPPLWTLFTVQTSIAVMNVPEGRLIAPRAALKSNPVLASKFRLPAGVTLGRQALMPAGEFKIGSFELSTTRPDGIVDKWTAAFCAVEDGPRKSWRYVSLAVLPSTENVDPAARAQVVAVLKPWETSVLDSHTRDLHDLFYNGPCCIAASTLNGEYFMFTNPEYLVAMMNTAVLWGPAKKSVMSFQKVEIHGGLAVVTGQWEVASLAFGVAPYAVTATLLDTDDGWKLASLCVGAGS